MRKSGSCTEMEGNELSRSEYLKCKNACVKVTINRYRRLCSGSLGGLRDAISWPSLVRSLERLSMNPHVDQWFKESFCANTGLHYHRGVCSF